MCNARRCVLADSGLCSENARLWNALDRWSCFRIALKTDWEVFYGYRRSTGRSFEIKLWTWKTRFRLSFAKRARNLLVDNLQNRTFVVHLADFGRHFRRGALCWSQIPHPFPRHGLFNFAATLAIFKRFKVFSACNFGVKDLILEKIFSDF